MSDKILSFEEAQKVLTSIDSLKYQSLVSIGSPGAFPPLGYEDFHGPKIRLEFRDAVSGAFLCSLDDIKSLISFLQKNALRGSTLFHCRAGVSRSSASCFIKQALLQEERTQEDANQAMRNLLKVKQIIFPNPRMVQMADSLLVYSGHLEKARMEAMKLPLFMD